MQEQCMDICLHEGILAEVRAVEVMSVGSMRGDAWSIRPGQEESQQTHKGQREIAVW